MAVQPPNANGQARPRRQRGHAAAIVALVALALAAVAWWWTARQPPPPDADLGLSHGVIVIGGGTFVLALIAQIRAMSFLDVLELLWALLAGLLSLIGALLRGLWSFICGLFGWD
jgi:xanthine/uracil permease